MMPKKRKRKADPNMRRKNVKTNKSHSTKCEDGSNYVERSKCQRK